jgi:two-component system, OmpR family, alkaline phosphatase synthesis response regulator PhoP
MAKETILLIEDEKNIVELVKYNLEQEGFSVLSATRGDTGLDLALKSKPNLVILDLMLPEIDGLEICKTLRQNEKTSAIPIIILTAKAQESDRIVGLELGADDYVTKPFSGREKPKDKILKAGILEIDTAKHVVSLKAKPIELTSKEYDLLKALMEAQGRVLTRDWLLEQVWGYHDSLNIETRTIDMHIGQLRKKIKTEGERIVTVKNVGYRFEPEN